MQNLDLFIYTLIFLIIFFVGANILTAFNCSLLSLGKFEVKELLQKSPYIRYFLKGRWEKFYTIISVTKHILYLLYAIAAFLFLLLLFPKVEAHDPFILLIALVIVVFFMITDFIMRLIARKWTKYTLVVTATISSIFLIIFTPFTFLILWASKVFFKKDVQELSKRCFITKDKVIEMIKDSELNRILTAQDQNIIASFLTFKEKVAREIMIPRVDIFSLEDSTKIKDANRLILSDNYSRIPVFHDNLDNIIGVLMYKDILNVYSKAQDDPALLDQPISQIIKPVIYTPENKKISKLLQEFRTKKIHLAIIVNEYGGTEGVVTIEDVLEELVGEIQDEYDLEEDKQFWQLPSGSVIVDSKLSIIDVEEQLNIQIPHSPEYETIGGYIFHKAGTIPSKGWKIVQDDFVIEVLISNERCIEKIRITPTKKTKES